VNSSFTEELQLLQILSLCEHGIKVQHLLFSNTHAPKAGKTGQKPGHFPYKTGAPA